MISTIRLFVYREQGGPKVSPRQRRRLIHKARREIHQPMRDSSPDVRRNYEFAKDLTGEMGIPFERVISDMLTWVQQRLDRPYQAIPTHTWVKLLNSPWEIRHEAGRNVIYWYDPLDERIHSDEQVEFQARRWK